MNSPNAPSNKKSKMQLLQSVKNLGSFLSHSTNYWKDTFDNKNFCSCARPEIDPMSIDKEPEDKKDLFKVVSNEKTAKKTKPTEIIYQKEWSKKESELLIENYYNNNIKNWKKLSEMIQTKSPQQCCYRIKRLEEKAKINSFTKQDDLNIMKYVELYGKNWEKIAQSFPKLTPNLIEERYNSKLDPFLKRTKFSSEEDEKILSLYEKYGNNWKEIASHFVDRNANMIKNRFYSVLKKRLLHSNNSGSSSYIDSHSFINSSLLHSIEDNGLDYISNMPNQFIFPSNEYTNHNINNDNDKCNGNESSDVHMTSNINHNENNIEMKDNLMFDNDSNHSGGGIIFLEDNSSTMKMDSFNEIYHKVFQNDIEKKSEEDIPYNHHSHLINHNDSKPIINHTLCNSNAQLLMNGSCGNDCNSIKQIAKISQTDDLFIESQKLEEILSSIDGEEVVINEYESVFPLNESDNKQFSELLNKKEKLAQYKETLSVQLKNLQNDYHQLKNLNNNTNIPQMLRQTLIAINDVLLKLISSGKMKVILKKQIEDFFQDRNSYNNNGTAYNNNNCY